MFNLIPGSKYKRLEVQRIFNKDIQSHSQLGYWSEKIGGEIFYLIFCNVGVESTNINGKFFDYPNEKISDTEFLWCSRDGVNTTNNEMLSNMAKNPQNVLFFYRQKGDPASLFTYFGKITRFVEIYSSKTKSEPSTYSINSDTFESLKFKSADAAISLTLEELMKDLPKEELAKTGLKGEYLIWDILHNRKEGIKKIEEKLGFEIDRNLVTWWYHHDKRKNRDFDVADCFLEVKTTKEAKLKRFFISDHEIDFAIENKEKYFVVIVANENFEIFTWNEINEIFKLTERRINIYERN